MQSLLNFPTLPFTELNMAKNIGYFVEEEGREGFVGGVGGPEEIIPRKELYSRMLILLQQHGRSRKPTCKGLEKADQIKDRWVTIDKASKREGREIQKR